MNIQSDISAASNGVYQLRARQNTTPSFDTINPRTPAPQTSPQAAQASRADSVAFSPRAARGIDTAADITSNARPDVAKAVPAQAELAAKTNEKPSEAGSNAAPPSFTMADLETMLSLFGQSYDLADAESADPLLVQYDLNGDGTIDADDLGELLGLIQPG